MKLKLKFGENEMELSGFAFILYWFSKKMHLRFNFDVGKEEEE